MKVIIDSREAVQAPSIAEGLRKLGVETVQETLEAGDYAIPVEEGYVIERKTVQNFVADVKLGRLWFELDKLKRVENMRPIVAIVGSLSLVEKFTKWKPSQVLGTINSIIFDWNIPVVFLPSNFWVAHYIYTLAKQSEFEEKRPVPINVKPKLETLEEQILYVVESLPGVSSARARSLIKHFKSVKRIANASIKELIEVEDIGEVTAEKIWKVFNTELKLGEEAEKST